jgi:hypothetical protein
MKIEMLVFEFEDKTKRSIVFDTIWSNFHHYENNKSMCVFKTLKVAIEEMEELGACVVLDTECMDLRSSKGF